MNFSLMIVLVFISIANCRDFYVGMFKKNDLLVAQDRLYKERVLYKHTYAKYGRIFKCKITYIRISDRLGYGPGPTAQIVRGGLNLKYVVLRLTSPYNMPISVNIYVGCANKFVTTKADTRANETKSINNTAHTEAGSQGSDGVKATEAACTTNCSNAAQTTDGQAAPADTTVAATTAK